MIKYVSVLFLSMITAVVGAQEIEIPVPFSPGGHFSALVPITADDLNKRGWKTSVKFVGKCGVAKESFETSKKPIMTIWATNWISSKDNTCYLDINSNNFVDIYMQAPLYLCGPKDNANWSPVAGSTYTVGVNNSVLKEEFQALHAYGKNLGVNFKTVTYTNTGGVRTAHQSKEVDMIFSSIGLEQHKTQQSRCLVTSGDRPFEDIDTIWNKTGLKQAPVWVGFLIMNSQGMSSEKFEKLRSDTRDIIAKNPDIKSYMTNKYLLNYPGSIESQLKFILQK